MGDRHIYTCPKCNSDIYVGGGINENEDGSIKCDSCKNTFKIVIRLINTEPRESPMKYDSICDDIYDQIKLAYDKYIDNKNESNATSYLLDFFRTDYDLHDILIRLSLLTDLLSTEKYTRFSIDRQKLYLKSGIDHHEENCKCCCCNEIKQEMEVTR